MDEGDMDAEVLLSVPTPDNSSVHLERTEDMNLLEYVNSPSSCWDVQIICKNDVLRSHRVLLASASIFLHDMLLSHGSENVTILLPDIESSTMICVLEMIYTGCLRAPVSQAKDVYALTKMLHMNPEHVVDTTDYGGSTTSKPASDNIYCKDIGDEDKIEEVDVVDVDSGSEIDMTLPEPCENAGKFNRTCQLCSVTLSSRAGFLSHMKNHESGAHFCSICDQTFHLEDEYAKHVGMHQGVHCSVCDKGFANRKSCAEHWKLHGSSENLLEKEEQSTSTISLASTSLSDEHTVVHQASVEISDREQASTVAPTTSSIPCCYCYKKFPNVEQLKRHHETHISSRPYRCMYCSRGFVRPSDRSKHEKLHKKIQQQMTNEKISTRMKVHPKKTQKIKRSNYNCSVCKKVFHNLALYKRHKKAFAYAEKKQCSLCCSLFCSSNDYRNHLRSHYTEKEPDHGYRTSESQPTTDYTNKAVNTSAPESEAFIGKDDGDDEVISEDSGMKKQVKEQKEHVNDVPTKQNQPHVCLHCGRSFFTVTGYNSHLNWCRKPTSCSNELSSTEAVENHCCEHEQLSDYDSASRSGCQVCENHGKIYTSEVVEKTDDETCYSKAMDSDTSSGSKQIKARKRKAKESGMSVDQPENITNRDGVATSTLMDTQQLETPSSAMDAAASMESAQRDDIRDNCAIQNVSTDVSPIGNNQDQQGSTTEQMKNNCEKVTNVPCQRCTASLDGKRYECTVCKIKFNFYCMLPSHRNAHRNALFTCCFCEYSSKSSDVLVHEKGHYRDSKLLCESCKLASGKRRRSLANSSCDAHNHETASGKHITNVQEKTAIEYPFVCANCGKGFTSEEELTEHNDIHHRDNIVHVYKCLVCDVEFGSANQLREHSTSHMSDGLFKCPVCNASFSSNSELQEHSSVHSRKKICSKCSKKCKTKHELLLHTHRHHHGKRYVHPCTYCKAKLFTQSNIITENHVQVFRCTVCQADFTAEDDLQKHTHLLHYDDNILLSDDESLVQTEAAVLQKCHICRKTFTSNSGYKKHMKAHTKVFPCSICGQTFTLKNSFRRHLRRAHGISKEELNLITSKVQPQKIAQRNWSSVGSSVSISVELPEDIDSGVDTQRTNSMDATVMNQALPQTMPNQKQAGDQILSDMFKCMNCHKAFFLKASLDRHSEGCTASQHQSTCALEVLANGQDTLECHAHTVNATGTMLNFSSLPCNSTSVSHVTESSNVQRADLYIAKTILSVNNCNVNSSSAFVPDSAATVQTPNVSVTENGPVASISATSSPQNSYLYECNSCRLGFENLELLIEHKIEEHL